MKRIIAIGISIGLTAWLSGCTVSSKDTIVASQSAPRMVNEVKEFIEGKEEKPEAKSIPNSVAILSFENLTDEPVASIVLRQVINSHLSGMNFQLMHPSEVDLRVPDGPIDPTQMAAILSVDGVLSGEVVTFERFFAGIYAQIKLGVVLRLHDANGELIWQTEEEVVQSAGGLSTTAWGLLLNAAVAAMHLDDENVLAAADELGRKIAFQFPQPEGYIPNGGPQIEAVLHDAAGKWLKYGDMIKVGLKGEPGLYGTVELENLQRYDLEEVEPGTYVANIPVEASWNEQKVALKGRLQDPLGNNNTLLSIAGLINFDNAAPDKVANLTGSVTPDNIKLTWNGLPDADGYEVWWNKGGEVSLLTKTDHDYLNTDSGVALFEQYQFSVYAVDKAGNKSDRVQVSLTSYPQEVGHQHFVTGAISGEYDGITMLTRAFSPYQVKGEVTFLSSSELYVEPGVVLRFDPDASISVQGQAYFWGTKKAISLEPVGEIKRKKAYLTLSSDKAVQMTGVNFVDAGQGVMVDRGQVSMDSIAFTNTRFTALTVSGEGSVEIKHCVIDGSNTSAVVVSDYGKLTMSNCTLQNNFPFHIQNASQYPVNAQGNEWLPDATEVSILGEVNL